MKRLTIALLLVIAVFLTVMSMPALAVSACVDAYDDTRTLNDAIGEANNSKRRVTIVLAGDCEMSSPPAKLQSSSAGAGRLVVDCALKGNSRCEIDFNDDRGFFVKALSGSGPSLMLNDLVLTRGSNASNLSGLRGGALYCSLRSTCTLNNTNVVDNEALMGGGIGADSGASLTVNGGVISGNVATGVSVTTTYTPVGGGIAAVLGATVTLNNTVVSGNWAYGTDNSPCGLGGGGVYVRGSTLALNNSEISGNVAANYKGGGIASFIADVDINKGSEVYDNDAVLESTGMDISLCGLANSSSTVDLNGGSFVDDINVDEFSDLFISKRAEYGDCDGDGCGDY